MSAYKVRTIGVPTLPYLPTRRPLVTTSTAVDGLIDWIREQLQTVAYGEVGLVFTMHNSAISRVKKIRCEMQQVGSRADGHADVDVNEVSYEQYNGKGHDLIRGN